MSPSKQIPFEKRQIMIFKVLGYCLIEMSIRAIGSGIEKCDNNLNFVVIIKWVYFVRVIV